MTYDELLARIDEDEKFLEMYFGWKFKGQSALRAVVELHKPNEFGDCPICVIRTFFGVQVQLYPCPTIQAIEEEMR